MIGVYLDRLGRGGIGVGVGGGVQVSAEQHLDDSLGGERGGELSLVSLDVFVRPVITEEVHNVQMVPLSCPVQSCPPIDVVLRVHVDTPG